MAKKYLTAEERRIAAEKQYKQEMKKVCVPVFDIAGKYKQLEEMMAALQPEIEKVQEFAKVNQLMFVPPMIISRGDIGRIVDEYGNEEYYEEPYGDAYATDYDADSYNEEYCDDF